MAGPETWPIGRLLATAARMVEHDWIEHLDTLGLTHAGLIALHLLGDGARSQTALARAARVELQTIVRTLDRLERHHLVARERDPADGRRVIVSRTDAGTELWHRARSLEVETFPAVTDPDALRTQLLEVLQQASGNRFDELRDR